MCRERLFCRVPGLAYHLSDFESKSRVSDLYFVTGLQGLRAADSHSVHVDAVRRSLVTHYIRTALVADGRVAAGDGGVVVQRNGIAHLAPERDAGAVRVQ